MKKISVMSFLIGIILLVFCGTNFAAETLDGDGNPVYSPGSLINEVDFNTISKGLYFDGSDYYFVLEQGVVAQNYLLNFHGEKYYFGEDGKMVKDQIVEYEEEKYYFDPNGTMLKNQWVTHKEIDPTDNTYEEKTYYFGPTGRAYRAKDRSNNMIIKVIDGERYGFDPDGVRLEGYVTKDGDLVEDQDEEAIDQILYYFDPEENYSTAKGWILYTGKKPEEYDDGEEMYFYFDEKTGRKVFANEPGKFAARIIEGERYLFDYAGVRQKKWYATPSNPGTPRYYSEDFEGFLTKGWFMAVPPKESIETKNQEYAKDEEEQWFYAAGDGRIVRNSIKKIGHYYYCFDRDGVMQSDSLVVVEGNTFVKAYKVDELKRNEVVLGKDEGGILENGQKWMYFMEPSDNENLVGAMSSPNKKEIVELGDEDVTFIASSMGGYGSQNVYTPIIRNGKYYQNGVLLKPESDIKYGIIRTDIPDDGNPLTKDFYVVVGKNGNRITKRGAFKDESGNYILVGGGSGACYLGTYNFSKCKLATVKNKGLCWVIDVGQDDNLEIPYNSIDTPEYQAILDGYKVSYKSSYLNFEEWTYVPSND